MLCLIYMYSLLGAVRPRVSCIYIRQSTLACVIYNFYINWTIKIFIHYRDKDNSSCYHDKSTFLDTK